MGPKFNLKANAIILNALWDSFWMKVMLFLTIFYLNMNWITMNVQNVKVLQVIELMQIGADSMSTNQTFLLRLNLF